MTLFSSRSVCGLFKQFVRYKSQRRSLGKPPGVARSLQQRLDELNQENLVLHEKVDIGFAHPTKKRRSELSERIKILKQNKQQLEEQARSNKLVVPLDEVQKEWSGHQTQAAAAHYAVYEHLFGDAYFTPALRLDVTYPGGYLVHRGNLLTPSLASSPPEVRYKAKEDTYWTLALTTPDGHLTSHTSEYLLWFVGNIRGSSVSSGEELASYMQPFPIKGLGYCRYIFLLYKQKGPIEYRDLHRSPTCRDPSERDFSTYEFYKARQDDLTPAGLCFFQAEWDQSVSTVFHQAFSSPEPICSYDFPQPYRPKQTWFPLGKAFNLYMDRYRDEKTIAKEYFLKKLRTYDPWTGFPPPLQFPNAIRFKPGTPSWLKNEIIKQRLGKARIHDY